MGYLIRMNLGNGLLIKNENINLLMERLLILDKSSKSKSLDQAMKDNNFSGITVSIGYLITQFEGQKAGWGEEEFLKRSLLMLRLIQRKIISMFT